MGQPPSHHICRSFSKPGNPLLVSSTVAVLPSTQTDYDFGTFINDQHYTCINMLFSSKLGVPEDSQRFLTFVNEVRRYRSASSAPIVVHCRYVELRHPLRRMFEE